jgi:hypothetical protein
MDGVEVKDDDKDKELPDPCTEDDDEKGWEERVLSDASNPRSSHTSCARSLDSLNSTASSRTAWPRRTIYTFSTSTDHIPHESERPLRHQERVLGTTSTSSFSLPSSPPTANCLIGRDHVQNILLLGMPVLYLHQPIEGLSICHVFNWTMLRLTPPHHLVSYSSLIALPHIPPLVMPFLKTIQTTASHQPSPRNPDIPFHARLEHKPAEIPPTPRATQLLFVLRQHSSRQLDASDETSSQPQA